MAEADLNTLYPLILKSNFQEKIARTSLMDQWLRQHSQCRGLRFNPLVRELDP